MNSLPHEFLPADLALLLLGLIMIAAGVIGTISERKRD